MKTKHTLTLGPLTEPKSVQDSGGDWNDVISDQNTGYRITIERDGGRLDNNYSIALVRAVNAHDTLVEALESIESLLDCGNREESHIEDCLGYARAALKLAKGEE